jgi:dTDP-glucose 4,6-dehydratase
MKIAVIGASSFTGKHFCEHARRQGAQVVEMSLRPGSLDPAALSNASRVVNFAALNMVAPSWQYPHEYMTVNCLDQIPIWDVLRDSTMLERYLHVSTPEVYGNNRNSVGETQRFNPSTPYAVSRAAAEMMLRCYRKQHGLPVVLTRSCNVYGPGQPLYRLIPKVVASIKRGVKFPLEGNGQSLRAWLYVSDVCDGIWRALMEGENGHAYHLSDDELHSVAAIVRTICNRMEVNPEDVIEPQPERPGKDMAYRLLTSKIRRLGWSKAVYLDAGIAAVIDYINANWEALKDEPLEYEIKL